MLTAVVDIGDTSVCPELYLPHKKNPFYMFLVGHLIYCLFLCDINDILIILSIFCRHTTVSHTQL